jgi:hypothetical protein
MPTSTPSRRNFRNVTSVEHQNVLTTIQTLRTEGFNLLHSADYLEGALNIQKVNGMTGIVGIPSQVGITGARTGTRTRRPMSAAVRRKIAQASKKRWAEKKSNVATMTKGGKTQAAAA